MSSFEKVRTANILHNERRQAWTEIKTDYRAAILFMYVGLAQRCQINRTEFPDPNQAAGDVHSLSL